MTLTAPAPGATRRRRGDQHPWLTLLAWIVAIGVLMPLAFLALAATQAGWSSVAQVFFRRLTMTLLVDTVVMTVLVTMVAAFLGVAAAWILERTDVPFRRTLLVTNGICRSTISSRDFREPCCAREIRRRSWASVSSSGKD